MTFSALNALEGKAYLCVQQRVGLQEVVEGKLPRAELG